MILLRRIQYTEIPDAKIESIKQSNKPEEDIPSMNSEMQKAMNDDSSLKI